MKKKQLDYRPIISITPSKSKVSVSAHQMEELDKVIRKKIKQNEAEHAASIAASATYTVR